MARVNRALAAATATARFTKVSQWETGYTAEYAITNTGATAINGWRLEFDLRRQRPSVRTGTR